MTATTFVDVCTANEPRPTSGWPANGPNTVAGRAILRANTHRTQPARRSGFTLVEMLTVIVIIGILAAMTAGGAIAARRAVIRGVIKGDMSQLDMALQKYRSDTGEFPPDFAFCDETSSRGDAARARVLSHLRKRFPRMRLADWAAFATATGMTAGPAATQLNPSTALAFWLGGPLDGTGKPKGFSEDPANPFKVGEPRSTPYFDFDPARMSGFQLMQPKVKPPAPYVYFRAVKNTATSRFEYGAANNSGTFEPFSCGVSPNICVPYLENASSDPPSDPVNHTRVWRAPETYQVIAAGLDGQFSTDTPAAPTAFRYSKIGTNFTDGDYDNLASFAEGELEKEM